MTALTPERSDLYIEYSTVSTTPIKTGHFISDCLEKILKIAQSIFDFFAGIIQRFSACRMRVKEVSALKFNMDQQTFDRMQRVDLPVSMSLPSDIQEKIRHQASKRIVERLDAEREPLHPRSTDEEDYAQQYQEIYDETLRRPLETAVADYTKFKEIFEKLRTSLDSPAEGSSTSKLQQVVKNIRALAVSPFYSTFWMCDDLPEIAALQRLVMTLYEGTAKEMYAPYGKIVARGISTEEKVSRKFFESMQKAYSQGFHSDISLNYLIFNAHRLPELSKSVLGFAGKYDPINGVGNTPCSLYKETISLDSKKGSITCIMTATPTVGNALSPEMHVMLKTLENNYFKVKKGELPETTPTHWNYCNLQGLASDSLQFTRSKAIIEAQRQYPFSFSAASIAINSPFHMDGTHLTSAENMIPQAIQAQKSACTLLDDAYAEELINHICHSDNYTLDHRKNPNAAYYFPLKSDEQKMLFKQDITSIVGECLALAQKADCRASAQELLKDQNHKDVEVLAEWIRKSLFRELVHLGMVRYFQLKQLHNTPGSLFATSACIESIDRGNKVSNQMLWSLADQNSQDEADQTLFDTIHGRPLTSAGRLILSDRAISFLALSTAATRQEVRELLNTTLSAIANIDLRDSSIATAIRVF